MADLGKRINDLRKQLNISQTELAAKTNISKSMINRYENKDVQPPADILNKIADVLNTSADYLLNGTSDQKAKANITDNKLLQQFKAVELFNDDDKKVVTKLIDAFIKTKQIEQLVAQ
jgi:transcriptional regulator with XRE-family HTH domain